MAEEDVACLPGQRVGQAARVEAHADRARITRLALGDAGAERLEPLERLVQLLDDQACSVGIAAGALGPELLERRGSAR